MGNMNDDACKVIFGAIIILTAFYRCEWVPSFLCNKNRFEHDNMKIRRAGQPNRG
jgi:hypothetical protein